MGFLTNPILSPMELERGISSLWDSRQPRPYVWEALRKESTYVLDMTLRNLARKSWFSHWERKWQPTPVVLPGKSQTEESVELQSTGSQKSLDVTNSTKKVLRTLNYCSKEKKPLGKGVWEECHHCACDHRIEIGIVAGSWASGYTDLGAIQPSPCEILAVWGTWIHSKEATAVTGPRWFLALMELSM